MILRVISKVWLISGISIIGLFWILGAKAYAEDVAIIESEMVSTAHWIQENTAPVHSSQLMILVLWDISGSATLWTWLD